MEYDRSSQPNNEPVEDFIQCFSCEMKKQRRTSDWRCYTCLQFFCEDHVKAVHSIPLYGDHMRVRLKGNIEGEESLLPPYIETARPVAPRNTSQVSSPSQNFSEETRKNLEKEEDEAKKRFIEEGNESELIIITPGEKHTLGIHRKNFRRLLYKMEEEGSTECVTITFSGATHAGKSTLIRTLMERAKSKDLKMPNVGEPGVIAPTTGNINVYQMQNKSIFNKGFIRMLDLEGEDGGNSIPVDVESSLKLQFYKTPEQRLKYMEGRRKAVRTQFPRVGYLTSNLLIYVSEEPFSLHTVYTRVLEFASLCTDGIEHSTAPALIIVHNRCNPQEIQEEDILTKNWLETHDYGRLLRSKYNNLIKCIHITDSRWDTKNGTNFFGKQMKNFENLIKKLTQKQLEFRSQQQIFPMTDENWLRFLHHSVMVLRFQETKNSSINFTDLSNKLKHLNEGFSDRACSFFEAFRYKGNTNFVEKRKHYELLVKLTVELMINFMISACNKSPEMRQASESIDPGELLKSTSRESEKEKKDNVLVVYENEWMKGKMALQKILIPSLLKCAPCAASFRIGSNIFPCIRMKSEHQHGATPDGQTKCSHSSGQVAITKLDNDYAFVKLWKSIQTLFKITTTHYWEGGPDIKWTEELNSYFTAQVEKEEHYKKKQRLNNLELVMDRIKIIHESWKLLNALGSTEQLSGVTLCLMCYDTSAVMILNPCKHKFCSNCVAAFSACIKNKEDTTCPVCSNEYETCIEELLEGFQDDQIEIELARCLNSPRQGVVGQIDAKLLDLSIRLPRRKERCKKDLAKIISFKLNPSDYLLDRKILIGRGTFCDVYLVRKSNGSHVCLKQFHVFDEDDKKAFYRDSAVLASGKSNNVVQFLGFLTDNNERPAIITEYCRGGNLKSYLQRNRLSKEEFDELALSVANALKEIHDRGIIHGRLHLSKVLLDANHKYKVGGFETAVIKTDKSSPSVDIKAYGSLLYQALCNELELSEPLTPDTIENVLEIPPEFKSLIKKCIKEEIHTTEELVNCIKEILS